MTTTTTACNSSVIVHGPSDSCEIVNSMLRGDLRKTGNSDELNPARIVASNIPFTSRPAYSQLMRGACGEIVPAGLAEEIVRGANSLDSHVRENCRFLGALAINLDELSKAGLPQIEGKPGSASLVGAKKKLTTLIERYLKNPALNIVGLDVNEGWSFKAGLKINNMIDALIKVHGQVFEPMLDQMYERYLEDGLVKALGERHGGCPDLQSAIYSRINGNASHSAKSHLNLMLEKLKSANSSESLAEFFELTLCYLDLHMPAESARPPEASPVNHPKRGRAQDDAVNAHPAGGTIFRSGDLTAPIEIKIDGIGKVSSSGAEQTCADTNALLSKELIRVYNELGKVKDDQIKAKDEQISDLRRQLSDHRVGDTRRGSDDDQVNTQPSAIRAESNSEAEELSDEVVDGVVPRAENGVSVSNEDRENIPVAAAQPTPVAPPLPTPVAPPQPTAVNVTPLRTRPRLDDAIADLQGVVPELQTVLEERGTVSFQAPTRPQTSAASGVGVGVAEMSEFMEVRNRILRNGSPVLDSNEPTLRRGSSDFGVDAWRGINRTVSVSSIGPDSSIQAELLDASLEDASVSPPNAVVSDASGDTAKKRIFEINTELMPTQAPYFYGRNSIQKKDDMSLQEEAFYARMASGIQGRNEDSRSLRDFIKQGKDPSKDTGEFRELYDKACKESPAFGVLLEKLYVQLERQNVLTGPIARVKEANKRYGGSAPYDPNSFLKSKDEQAPERVDEPHNAAS